MAPAQAEKLLQVTFHYQGQGNAYQELVQILSQFVATTPGLIWKTWLINERQAEAGGLYLFTNTRALEHYLHGSIMTSLEHCEDIGNVSVKIFDTLNEIPLIALKRWRDNRSSI